MEGERERDVYERDAGVVLPLVLCSIYDTRSFPVIELAMELQNQWSGSVFLQVVCFRLLLCSPKAQKHMSGSWLVAFLTEQTPSKSAGR